MSYFGVCGNITWSEFLAWLVRDKVVIEVSVGPPTSPGLPYFARAPCGAVSSTLRKTNTWKRCTENDVVYCRQGARQPLGQPGS